MSSAPPTRRELIVVVVLFLLCALLSHNDAPSISDSLPKFVTDTITTSSPAPRVHNPHKVETRLSWSSAPPETAILSHVPGMFRVASYCFTPYLCPGWTIIDKLYIFQGIVYVVSDSPSNVPDIRFLYSKALNIEEGKEAEDSRLPDASDIQVISTKQAAKLFGTGAHVIDGVSVRLLCISYLL